MNEIPKSAKILLGLLLALLLFFLCSYTVSESETIIITQFGKVTGAPVTSAGLHFKLPFIQSVNRLDVRIHEWDGKAVEMPTGDKLYIIVDSFGRWKISDPLLYFTRLRDERSALSRMDDIIGSEIRNAVAKNNLIEIVRTDKNRKVPVESFAGQEQSARTNEIVLPPIRLGRTAIEKEVSDKAAAKLKEFGIELVDTRFMRINYHPSVMAKINERMISERQQIAERYRSEGQGEAAKIQGNREKDLAEITSEAYKQVQIIRGQADAKAAEIYAKAYNQSPAAIELYSFLRTMETYKKIATNDMTLVITTDSDFFKYFKKTSTAK